MSCKAYIRTEILSFCDLTPEQQSYAVAQFDWDDNIDDSQFVPNPIEQNEVLHMDNFFVTFYKRALQPGLSPNRGYWDAVHDDSAFSAYFMKLSKCGTGCVVAYRCF